MKGTWVRDPHSGGTKIPEALKVATRKTVLEYANKNYAGKFIKIDVRFRGQLCYIDAYTEPDLGPNFDASLFNQTREERIEFLRNVPTHLCRLRYFSGHDHWSMAFYSYSSEKYEPSFFDNGTFYGTPEEAFQTSAVYLD